jgi:hypothetical protein
MTARRALAVVFELAMLAANVGGGGPIADGVRTIGLIVAALLGAVVVFVTAIFAVALLDQRKPPYPI